MTEYKIVRDPVHGNIKIKDVVLELMDTPELQRLNSIHQLGFTYLVYPGAHHSRIEHSLGTSHIARLIASTLGLEAYEKNLVSVVGLLHDVGHGPYSHTLENIISSRLKKNHMEITKEVITGEYDIVEEKRREAIGGGKTIPEILETHGFDPHEVAELVSQSFVDYGTRLERFVSGKRTTAGTKDYLSQIIHGTIDADQIDYLLRDAHYTGVAYGIIDAERLIQTLELHNNNLVVHKKGVSAVEGMLVARGLMFSAVYFHKTVRIAELMMARAVEKVLGKECVEEIHRMVDSELLNYLEQQGGFPQEMVYRLKYRKLFKRAYTKNIDDLKNEELDVLISLEDLNKRKIKENTVCRKTGAPPGYVIIDTPGKDILLADSRLSKIGVKILDNGTIGPIGKYSPLANAIRNRRIVEWGIMVFAHPEYKGKVSRIANDILFG